MGAGAVGIVEQYRGQGGIRIAPYGTAELPGQPGLHLAAEQEVDERPGVVLVGSPL